MGNLTKETEKSVMEQARQTPLFAEVDVVVCGGGPGGVPAALAAARQGAEVLLIEHYGFLGGLASAGMIGPLFGFHTAQATRRMLGGIPVEILKELQWLEGAPVDKDISKNGIPFEPEMMKHALERLAVREKKIRFLYHSSVVGVIREGDRIDCILVENKSGRMAIRGKIFIDATGDGDVAFQAGCSYTKGRRLDGAMQSMGTKFRMGGVRPDITAEESRANTETFRKAIKENKVPVYHPFVGEVSEFGATLRTGEETPTVTRARGDGTNVVDLTRNEIKFRADTLEIVDFCRKNVIGLKKCYLMATPTQIGVRETRQITGQYILTGDECLSNARFEDGIARGSWFLDIHCPMGKCNPETWCCDQNCKMPGGCLARNQHFDTLYKTLFLKDDTYYEIPYRSIVAKDVENLFVSGRCISADHGAMSSLRVIGTCFAIGEAAGTAAGMSLKKNCSIQELSGTDVRKALMSNGVPL